MKLSISNIGWTAENDMTVYDVMKSLGYTGLEIAPTRVFSEGPYEKQKDAREWANMLKCDYGFEVPSMQSIWYGRNERLFGTVAEREALLDYTKKAILFAEAIECKNLVFGCPRNRYMPDGADENIVVAFLREVGDYAFEHHTIVAMEANPPIYNTNYINDTCSALKLVEKVGSLGFKLNLDTGTIIENREGLSSLSNRWNHINHVHVSEPGLKPIEHRELHRKLADELRKHNYHGYVSIEVGKQENTDALVEMMEYVREVFGDSE